MKITRKIRTIISTILATALLFSFTACNKHENTSETESTDINEGKYYVLVDYTLYNELSNTSKQMFAFDIVNGDMVWSFNQFDDEYKKFVNGNLTEQIIYVNKKFISWYVIEYNEDGKVTKNTEKNIDGTIKNWYEIKYEASGKIIEETGYNADGLVISRNTYSYNKNGDQTVFLNYNFEGAVVARYEQQYDERGNKTKYISQENGEAAWVQNEYKYDDNGIKTEVVQYSVDGVVKAVDKFDANGNIIEHTVFSDNGEIQENIKTEYDSKGNRLKFFRFKNGVLTEHYEWKYVNGFLTEYITFNNQGQQISRSSYKNDAKGNIIEYLYYDKNDVLNRRIEQMYDTNGNIIEKISYTTKGEIEERRVYTYDDKKLATEKIYDGEGLLYKGDEKKFDENGNLIEHIKYNGGIIWERYEWQYDLDGNKTQESFYDLYSLKWHTEYKYSDGLLTETIHFGENGELTNRREYTYDLNKKQTNCIYYDADGTKIKREEYKYKYVDMTEKQYEEYQNILKSRGL